MKATWSREDGFRRIDASNHWGIMRDLDSLKLLALYLVEINGTLFLRDVLNSLRLLMDPAVLQDILDVEELLKETIAKATSERKDLVPVLLVGEVGWGIVDPVSLALEYVVETLAPLSYIAAAFEEIPSVWLEHFWSHDMYFHVVNENRENAGRKSIWVKLSLVPPQSPLISCSFRSYSDLNTVMRSYCRCCPVFPPLFIELRRVLLSLSCYTPPPLSLAVHVLSFLMRHKEAPLLSSESATRESLGLGRESASVLTLNHRFYEVHGSDVPLFSSSVLASKVDKFVGVFLEELSWGRGGPFGRTASICGSYASLPDLSLATEHPIFFGCDTSGFSHLASTEEEELMRRGGELERLAEASRRFLRRERR